MRPERRLAVVPGCATMWVLLSAVGYGTSGPSPEAPAMAGAELEPRTERAYEAYSAQTLQEFRERVSEPGYLWATADPDRRRALARGEIVVAAGDQDGILEVPGGLIHHWIGAVFVPGVRIGEVAEREQQYEEYPRIHEPILEAEFLGRSGHTDRVRLRIEQRTRFVHAVIDTWWQRVHVYPAPDRAHVLATAERIQQVENAGTPDERRLPPGEGGGYLWRANTYLKILEADGGTYLEFQTLGLSRGFPWLLGWLAEPIVRRIGRGSVARTLDERRANLTAPGD